MVGRTATVFAERKCFASAPTSSLPSSSLRQWCRDIRSSPLFTRPPAIPCSLGILEGWSRSRYCEERCWAAWSRRPISALPASFLSCEKIVILLIRRTAHDCLSWRTSSHYFVCTRGGMVVGAVSTVTSPQNAYLFDVNSTVSDRKRLTAFPDLKSSINFESSLSDGESGPNGVSGTLDRYNVSASASRFW